MPDEPWLNKSGWSYVPCHWMGFLVIFALVAMTLASIGVVELLAAKLGAPWISHLSVATFSAFLIADLSIAGRHSRRN